MIVTSYSDICKEDPQLRPYQQKAKKEIFESWDEVDNVMFQMPTGTGKTRLFTSIISDINKYSIQRREAVKILIIAHRTELIDQIGESLDRYRVGHNFMAGGRERKHKYPVYVASIQTIAHNMKEASKLNVQFVIIDEAHHALAKTYKRLWEMYPNAKRLGVTATPWRMNHQSFLDLFDKLVMSMPIKDFIKQGYLAPYKYYSLKDDSDIQRTIDGIELDSFGEYKESSMEEKMDIGSIRAQLLDSYLSLAEGKKGIIYAINRVHAKHICEEYQKAGYKAVSIDSKTPAGERKDLEKKFKKGEIDIIVNVDIFSEGYDCPDIEFIQLARPTRSLAKYLQQVGRGLRITANKQNCVILDNVGMYSRFGLPDARRHWKYHFIGKDVDEEPKRLSQAGGSGGSQRYVDLSEGTEDMELIQDNYGEVEVKTIPSSAINDFFPLFGVTLGKTTWKDARDMGYEVKKCKPESSRTINVEKVDFWDHEGEGIFTSLYWTRDESDFPSLWKAKGFDWNLSFEAWMEVFKNIGYIITVTRQPNQKTSSAEFEALSPDGTLNFIMEFDYGEDGYYTSSPKMLYSITVDYKGVLQEKQNEDAEEEVLIEDVDGDNEVNSIEEDFSAINDFFPIFGVTLGKTTWEQARRLGGEIKVDEDTGEIYFDIENVHFVDYYNNNNTLTDIYLEESYRDFPDSWNSKGFYWENSYDAWLDVFKRLGYNIEIKNEPELKVHDGRNTLSGRFEALSPDGTLSFNMDFRYGKKGHFTSSPGTLYSMSVHYHKSPVESRDDEPEDEEYVEIEEDNPLKGEDVEKLKHAFSKKSTSYKYFWFMALLEIYKETLVEKITFRQILIKMVAKAWKYVFMLNGQFSQSDQLPKYLVRLKAITNLHNNSLEWEVEDKLNKKYDTLNVNTILSPLLKNVPYRFLSPWIPFTDNDDVKRKTWNQESRCPYELHNDHVVISDLWREFLTDYYNSIQLLTEYGLESYLTIDQEFKEARDFYNTRFTSLNQLLKGIKRRKGQEDVKVFLEKYSFPLSGDITPAELMKVMPESSCVIDRDGRKRVNVPGEMWSLKILDTLLSEEKLNDEYDGIHILEGYGAETYLKIQNDIKTQSIIDTKYVSLSKLLQAINRNKDEKVVKQFLEKYNLSSKGDIKPSELMNIIPDSVCTIDRDGRKRVNLPGDMWSLKLLDKLLSD